jgi:hypothetical protein
MLNGNAVLGEQGTVEATQPIPGSLLIDGNIHGTGTVEPLMTLECKAASMPAPISRSVLQSARRSVISRANRQPGHDRRVRRRQHDRRPRF